MTDYPATANFHGFDAWPEKAIGLSPTEIQKAYESGFAGVYEDPQAKDDFEDHIRSHGGYAYGTDAAHFAGWAGSGAGELHVPYVWVFHHFGACWPGRQGQGRGDCVSWSGRNSNLLSCATEIQDGKPDEVTGKAETVPEIPAAGIADGCFATEVPYWYRGHGGDGWQCYAEAKVSSTRGGLVTRDDHTATLGLDLTRYNSRTAGRWGRSAPPQEIEDRTDDNLVRTATTLRGAEELRDFLSNGYGVTSCGGEGFSNRRDEHGVSRQQGRWAHAMAYIGFDDRPWAHQEYGGPLVLVLNSWAKWNGGPREIHDSAKYVPAAHRDKWQSLDIVSSGGNLMIPEGSFWARWRDVSRRSMIAKSSVNGWPKRNISTLGAEGNI